MSTTVSSSKARPAASLFNISSLVQQGAVLLFGALILFAVGFMPLDIAHNAAHDTRHSFVFPCH
ncbi:CbtB domain-containing protein [Marinimicrobium locisalis]|uniref:CbtB domain-containing protein n=1 Tax=Marinimicrobium locisalis TaxID=546022 RepID=UPI003D2FBC6D